MHLTNDEKGEGIIKFINNSALLLVSKCLRFCDVERRKKTF